MTEICIHNLHMHTYNFTSIRMCSLPCTTQVICCVVAHAGMQMLYFEAKRNNATKREAEGAVRVDARERRALDLDASQL
jgi:hypothetical protein